MNARTMTITAIVMHIAGCTPLEPVAQPQPAPIIQARGSETDFLLSRFDATQAQTKDEFKAEVASLQRQLAAAPTPYLRTHLALMLSAPHAENRDLPQALKLLEEVVKDPQSGGSVKNFAVMLRSYVAATAQREDNVLSLAQRVKEERRRADQAQAKQDESVQLLEQKLREEQKRSEAAAGKQDELIQRLTNKLREEQKRNEELQQKLDTITKIEKSLIDRQEPKEAPKELPKEAPKDAPKDAPKQAPKEPK